MMTSLAHLSDLHFGRERPDVVAGLLTSLAEQQPHTVIISGDLTQRARLSEYAAARAFLGRIDSDCLIIPGNHDISAFNLLQRFLYPWAKWRDFFGETLETEQDKDEGLLLGINTTRRWGSLLDWSRGRISNQQIQHIRARLDDTAPHKLRLLAAHHPFWLPADQRHRGLIGNHQAALAAFGNGHLDLIFSGHVHLAFNRVQNGIIISHAGSSTSDRLLAGHPNSYKLIHGDRNRLSISLFVWNGEKFDCQKIDSFVRLAKGWAATESIFIANGKR